MTFTADEYAVWERAEARIRSRAGKRARREAVAVEMAQAVLDGASAQTRARHAVVLHVDSQTAKGWYETDRGVVTASDTVVEEALATSPITLKSRDAVGPSTRISNSKKRLAIPTATMLALLARSGARCEVPGCGRDTPLHAHHLKPWSEGGSNNLDNLELRCSGCHGLGHAADYEQKPHWRKARQARAG